MVDDNLQEMKRIVAEGLHEGGFGEDPIRNWDMATKLIADTRFTDLCKEAELLLHFSGSPTSMKQAKQAFWRQLAYTIYEISLGLQYPSVSPEINWRAAQSLERWLVKCWLL